MIASVTYSQTLNNPTDADGYYIVKWDCDQGAFADSNDLEVDETFTFVIDVTGTPFEDWLLETPTAAGATRALAINKWTNYGDVSGGTNRLKQISPNVEYSSNGHCARFNYKFCHDRLSCLHLWTGFWL